jgi:phosphoserine aminotransferase
MRRVRTSDLLEYNRRMQVSSKEASVSRVYNFSAGPAILPEEVLKEAADEMLDYHGSGMSVMEMSHRSKWFQDIIDQAEADLRELVGIPDTYTVLFLQGGASIQFSNIPLNFAKPKHGVADYIVTGQWSKKAFKEASRLIDARKVASGEDDNFTHLPDLSDLELTPEADYVYICENETVHGLKYHTLPDVKGKDLIADVSSCFLSEPMDVEKYAMFYAGAQKNVGPAGTVIAVIRTDLIPTDDLPGVPTLCQYRTEAEKKSLYNTPPCYGIYICGKVFQWVKKTGGLQAMKERNEAKAKLLYDAIDESKLFKGAVVPEDRSIMNVPFVTGDPDLDAKFVKEATAAGLTNLKGHRSVGGLRASIYNAMPVEGVQALVDFMKKFETANA